MNIRNRKYLVIWVSACTLIFAGCKKDKTPPVVTLNGEASMMVAINGTYSDPGATAIDEEDGDLTSQIEVSGSVTTSTAGSYTITYTVTDKKGNVGMATRTVTVDFMASNYVGSWAVTDDCPITSPLADNQTIEETDATTITIKNFLDLVGGDVPCTVNGKNLTVVETVLGTPPVTSTVNGSGSISADGSTITINYSIENALGTDNCTATYARQ